MPIASNGKIWINPALCFADLFAYDQIKHYKKPAIRLCGSGGQLHWTLAYGAKQTGSWLWRNYYFLQIDNGAKVGVPGDKKNGGNYTKVDLEEGVRKTTILRHNYIAITTKDDIPGEVEVHYSILGNNGQNEVKTPFHTNIAANRKYIHV